MAELADLIVGVIVLLAVGLSAVLMITMFNSVAANPEFNALADNNTKDILTETTNTFYMWDYAGAFVFFMIMLVSVMAGALVRSHPIFFVFSVLFMIIWASIAFIFSVVYTELMSNAIISSVAAQFTWTLLLFQYLPFIGLVFLGIVAVATHGKT